MCLITTSDGALAEELTEKFYHQVLGEQKQLLGECILLTKTGGEEQRVAALAVLNSISLHCWGAKVRTIFYCFFITRS